MLKFQVEGNVQSIVPATSQGALIATGVLSALLSIAATLVGFFALSEYRKKKKQNKASTQESDSNDTISISSDFLSGLYAR